MIRTIDNRLFVLIALLLVVFALSGCAKHFCTMDDYFSSSACK